MDERDLDHAPEAGARIGLGRVIENPAGLGDGPRNPELIEPDVDASSDASFPASDPPAFMADPPTPRNEGSPRNPERPALPDPRDVP